LVTVMQLRVAEFSTASSRAGIAWNSCGRD
jgi:hypothetical protein